MSVQSEIDRISGNVADTYNVLESYGAEMPHSRNTENLPKTAENINAVLYKEQTLTEEQKAQARKNIGAVGGSTFDPTVYGLPVLHLTGDTTGMSKENAVTLGYAYGERSGTATLKWQGSSSLAYPKKNYTIKFDNAFEASAKWGEQKKYCLKANFIDHSHARNIVSAKLWGQIVKSRDNVVVSGANIFDAGKITHFINNVNGDVYWARFENGILHFTSCVSNMGYPYMVGQTYKTGDYTISFDVYNNNLSETDNINVLCMGFGIGNAISEKTLGFTTRGEWVHVEMPITNMTADAYLYIAGYYGVGSQKTDLQVKNIQVIQYGSSGIGDLVNGGAVDGFPCVIMLNNTFHGLYTFNIPKDGWMMGMGEGTNEAILCADYSDACWFKGEATLNGDFDLEYVSDENDTAWVTTSVNRLINACINSDGTDLDTTIAQYLDWDSAIDYYIFKYLLNGVDMAGKNYILATYDGIKWFFSAYDMDCVYGLDWDGKTFYTAINGKPFDSGHTVDNLILTYKKNLLKARYAELRSGVMSDDNVATMFTNFVGSIPTPLFIEDVRKWPTIPNSATNNVGQIIDYYVRRAKWLDEYMETL